MGLPADSRLIQSCARIDLNPTIQKHSCGLNVAVFGGHVQQRRTSKREEAGPGNTEIEFRETSVEKRGVSLKLRGQVMESASQQIQNRQNVVFTRATRLEKSIDASAKLG